MRNVVIVGQISTMSNKNDSKFKQEVATKTAYITVDAANAKKLEEFGLTKYTSKEGEDFFAMKTVRELSCYNTSNANEEPAKFDLTVDTGTSLKTADGVNIKMNIISSENVGNTFFRLQAIMIKDSSDIEEIVAINPFAESE